ncbi:MurR/RpiR family transcriptional regulator [bacterium]|nr:MurR/RpiR family transcriptional regulator [bacterium]
MKGIIIKLRSLNPSLKGSEKKLVSYIIDNAESIIYQSLNEVALKSKVSEATVIRFSRKIGLKGFQDLKLHLSRDIVSPVKSIHGDIEEGDDAKTIISKVFSSEIQTLQDTMEILDIKEIKKTVRAIENADNVVFVGVGTSGPNTTDAYNKFIRLGLNCHCHTDSHLQVMAASLLKKGDVVIAVSHSGSTKDPIETLQVAKKHGAVTVAITNNSISPITSIADIVLNTASRETRLRSEAMASRIAQTAIIDSLYTILAMKNMKKTMEVQRAIEESIVIKQY